MTARDGHRYRTLLRRTRRHNATHDTRGGLYRIRVRARDRLGNVGRWAVRTVRTRA